MGQTIVQITFKLKVDAGTYRDIVTPVAETFAGIEGCQWKIWLLNEAEHEAGAVYLFDDAAAARAYLEGPLIANLKQAPFLSDVTIRQFGVIEDLSEVTHGPIATAASGASANA